MERISEAEAEVQRLLAGREIEQQMLRNAAARLELAEAELKQLRSRMAEGANAAFKCPDGLHPTWLLDPEVECPWCEVDRLRAQVAALEDATDDAFQRGVQEGGTGR